MFLTIMIIIGIIIISGSASVIYSTKNLPKDYQTRIAAKVHIPAYNPLDTDISKVYYDELKSHPNKSGAVLIKNGTFALLHRVALVRMAKHSIELQTYIYENDITSRLLMHEMKLAADRGVKVRILVDDHGLSADTDDIMTLNYHPNISVKVFNPYKYRNKLLKYPQFLFNINRLNYRMHNKLFIVDNSAVIVGGRNIAGNYFDDSAKMNFSDTDVLFIGKLALDASLSFNEYWNYHKSVPVDVFPDKNNPKELEELDEMIMRKVTDYQEEEKEFNRIIDYFIKAYNNKEFDIYWGGAKLIGDNPNKTDGDKGASPIIDAINGLWEKTNKSIYIASAYFVPGKDGTNNLIESHKKGVDIHILTNSLASTDAKVVYSAWDRYRDKLIDNGINVYEFKPEGYKVKNKFNSGASLHSKTIVVDEKISWIGSFNLDGRSALYNTEIIVAFFNEDFARIMQKSIEDDMNSTLAWKLDRKDGTTYWLAKENNEDKYYKDNPQTSVFMKILMVLMKIIPEKLV